MDPRVVALIDRRQYVQRSPEWYEARESLITASDAAAALDIKPYEKFTKSARAELLKKKCNPVPFSSPFMAHGVKYEDEARRMYENMSGEEVLEFGLLIHPNLPWLGASPDGITKSGKLVEIKCPVSRAIVPGVVPEHYMPQVQVCMEVCDLEEAVFIQYKPEEVMWPRPSVLDITYVKRDRKWFEDSLEHLRSFWQEMMEQKNLASMAPPPPPLPTKTPPPPKPIVPSLCLIREDLYCDDENSLAVLHDDECTSVAEDHVPQD